MSYIEKAPVVAGVGFDPDLEEPDAEELELRERERAELAPLRVERSDLYFVTQHLIEALDCFSEVCNFAWERADFRGLSKTLCARALAGAADRADALASELRVLTTTNDFTADDWPWLEPSLRRICRSRRLILDVAERDFRRTRDPVSKKRDWNSPEYDNLAELEETLWMYRAKASVGFIGEMIRLTLDGTYQPLQARMMAAEELSSLHASLREMHE